MDLLTQARRFDARARGVEVDASLALVERLFDVRGTFVRAHLLPFATAVEVDAGGVHLLVPDYELPHGTAVELMVPCPHCDRHVPTGERVSYLGNLAVTHERFAARRVNPVTRVWRSLIGCRH